MCTLASDTFGCILEHNKTYKFSRQLLIYREILIFQYLRKNLILHFTGSNLALKGPSIAITYPLFAYTKLYIENTSTDFLTVGSKIYRHSLTNASTLGTNLSEIPRMSITLFRAETVRYVCSHFL